MGQITYEKGYIIDNDNQKIECLIKNYDWKNNPKEIEFKTSETHEPQKAELASIKEFGILGYSKFIRVETNIDRSSNDITRLSTQRNPEWSKETFFLKVLVEGRASLFYYEDETLNRLFYSINDSVIQQLIHKEFLTENNSIANNNKFREQLWINVRIRGSALNSVENLNYDKNTLRKYFIKYNQRTENSFVEYDKKKSGDSFHLKLVPGINRSNIAITNNVSDLKNTDFGNKATFSLQLGIEFILPFNKNKWGIVFEPTYQNFNSTSQNSLGNATISYNSIEFPIGVRYYLFLNNDLKLFMDGLFIPGFCPDFHSTIKFDYPFATPLETKTRASFAFGGGVGFSRLSLGIRYYTNKDILSDYGTWKTEYQRFSVLVGYKLL